MISFMVYPKILSKLYLLQVYLKMEFIGYHFHLYEFIPAYIWSYCVVLLLIYLDQA